MSAQPFLEAMTARRTYYALTKNSPISAARIQEIVKHALLHVPSSFNSQSTRVLLLFGAEHDKLWDLTLEILKTVTPEEKFEGTRGRISGFRAGFATILFFDDRIPIQTYQQKLPLYADRFPLWAAESNGMHQYAIWTALEAEGMGANLQHYNPLIDQRVVEEWGISKDWELKAQLVVGGRAQEAGVKTFQEVEDVRMVVRGL